MTHPPLRIDSWRIALFGSGLAMLIGGPMHPAAEGPLLDRLATMTADPAWVPAHALVVLSTVLLALGLALAARRNAWPTAPKALRVAVAAISLYLVETIFHLAAAVDSHALHHGEPAPVAFTHLGLSVVLYPVAGLAIAALASRQVATWPGRRRFIGVLGVLGGTLHAVSAPLTVALPSADLSTVFAASAVLIAVWTMTSGVAGSPRRVGLPAASGSARATATT